MNSVRQFVDLPPIWLLGFLALSWSAARIWPGLVIDAPLSDFLAGVLIGGGAILVTLAVFEMNRSKTTIIPHRDASTLVQTGIYKRSRNPIYLADLAFFVGFTLWWGAVICLPLVVLLGWILTDRFIVDEENRLSDAFGRAFEDYTRRTRRWI